MKPFTKTELKMMVYRRTQQGMSYDQACKEVSELIEEVKQNRKKKDRSKVEKN